LLAQLVIGGILVIPLGEGEEQVMNVIIKKSGTEFDKKAFGKFKFVPMLQNKT
jgi:protein-L-isoaspartate(D-aspartate) O-methyltransferase